MTDLRLSPVLTPNGRLLLGPSDEVPELEGALAGRLEHAFARGPGHGLLRLGAAEIDSTLPPVFAYWREFAARYVTALCTRPDVLERGAEVPAPDDLEGLVSAAPPMPGADHLNAEVLEALWGQLGTAFAAELAESKGGVQSFLKSLNPVWNLLGRVHFNLAENRRDEAFPFAFLATYTSRLTAHGKAQHVPLGEALREYAGAANKERLLSLLLPVQRAAAQCAWLKKMVDAGEIFHPLRWSPQDAFQFLGDVPELERAGVAVRMPAHWKASRPPRARVTASLGTMAPARLGKEALLDFQIEVSLDGERLTPGEVKELLAGARGLALLRGHWVEVDGERLGQTIERFREAERLASSGGLSFAEAMRLLSGVGVGTDAPEEGPDPDWSSVVAGPWLAETLKGLRSPEGLLQVEPGAALRGTLRPYQEVGVRWLHLLSRLGLGACLADDMGLGKTIQVLSLLLLECGPQKAERGPRPSLLVAPASLLANWAAEIDRFAPSLRRMVAHPSSMPSGELKSVGADALSAVDLVITSYGSLLRLPWLSETTWDFVVLDEAQTIKNPSARQTREAKKLRARARIALTGTPVENRLGDLWSIFDFINPGLLGTASAFRRYTKSLPPHNPFGPLRDLVRPYILRRLKTDKSVISDLPQKTEVKAYCPLSRKQAALYQDAVKELGEQLSQADGIKRRGVVLAFLVRFKQICNHPSQWLGDGAWSEQDSGKWARLREVSEVISAKQEKVLVFTQFREMTGPLSSFLGGVFGRPGIVLHGETEVKRRRELVKRFQEDESVPFFVLSLKAGGTGLNLTAASHVIHFDRWWNPAVEDQATDRAFRIGQTRNVLVHKFLCRGTVEEKIDALIESKKKLSRDLLEGGAEINLTEMDDEDLLRLVALDLNAAMAE